MPTGKKKKNMKKEMFCIFEVTKERSRIRSWIPSRISDPLVRGTDPRIGIRTRMSRIPNTVAKCASIVLPNFFPFRLPGKEVWVGWPHLVEAKVRAVSTARTLYTDPARALAPPNDWASQVNSVLHQQN